MLKAVIFDFDGILVDSEPLHYRATLAVSRTLGLEMTYPQYLQTCVGFDDRSMMRMLLRQIGQDPQARDQAYVAQLVAQKSAAFVAAVEDGCQAFPGVPALVAQLAAQMPVAVASGALLHDIHIVLGRLNLLQYFNPIITTDRVHESKPDPATYRLAVEELAALHPHLQIKPADCLAIEDTPAGVESARGAGLMTLGVTTTCDAGRLHRAHRVIERLAGLSAGQLHQWFD